MRPAWHLVLAVVLAFASSPWAAAQNPPQLRVCGRNDSGLLARLRYELVLRDGMREVVGPFQLPFGASHCLQRSGVAEGRVVMEPFFMEQWVDLCSRSFGPTTAATLTLFGSAWNPGCRWP